jgi:hypothetical protein
LSIPVDQDLLGGCLDGGVDEVSVGSLDELADLEAGSGPDEIDEVACVDRAAAGLRGLDELNGTDAPCGCQVADGSTSGGP